MLNLAFLHEAIAEAVPDRECLVFRERRFSWAEFTDRSRRLAALLAEHGLGCHTERAGPEGRPEGRLENWESGQDAVALYLTNGNEYLEGMLGAFKARAVPVNVNYRYVEEELLYLFRDASARAVIFHARFAPRLAAIRDQLPGVRLWVQVPDESDEPLLAGALDYEKALAAVEPRPPRGLTPDDLYVLYTGGTTGMPKGVLWRQEDIFRAALAPGSVEHRAEAVVERARRGGPRVLPAPPFMHGAAHWVALSMWLAGGSVVVQSRTDRLDAHDVWATAEREAATALLLVGDAFATPLLEALSEGRYDLSALRLISSSGAILSATRKRQLLAALPGVKILDALGSSESGQQGSQSTRDPGEASSGDFDFAPNSTLLRDDLSGEIAADSPDAGEEGWLARRGAVPLGYLGDREKTARTFPVIDGVRWAVPGDRARRDPNGRLRLLGRDSVCINTGGEKVFAEEVEHALKHHPAVRDVVVVGVPHERWGSQVTAVLALREGQGADEQALQATAAEHIARYKLPRAFVFVDEVLRAPSGKPDYAWARQAALDAGAGAD